MNEDTLGLSSLAEIAITLTGFTGLIASLRRRPIGDWHPRVRYNFWMTLCHGVCTFALAGAWGGPSAATYHFGVAIWLVLGLISFIPTLLYPLE